jgi:hypothetical protein
MKNEWKLLHCILHFKRLKHSHTATNNLSAIQVAIRKFSLIDKIFRVVTDSGSNVVKACRLGAIPRTSCFAHCLHLSGARTLGCWSIRNLADDILEQDCLESSEEVEDVEPTVQHDMFEKYCKESGLTPHNPFDMKMWWNSTFEMIVSAKKRREALDFFLHATLATIPFGVSGFLLMTGLC